MNRIGYYEEDGKLKMEWQEVTPITKGEAMYKIVDKPVYLQIFFHRELEEDELFDIYAMLIDNNIIEMDREEMDRNIQKDLERQLMGTWELKCDFQNALDCAVRLGNDILFHAGAFTFQISDEPTKFMKNWLKEKDQLKQLQKKVAFNPNIYHDEHAVNVYIDKNPEMNFLARLIERMILNGATEEEISDIVKYSMVVMDANKKRLNWRQAAIDFRVEEMGIKYMPESKKVVDEPAKIDEITEFLAGAVKKFGKCDISNGAELDFDCPRNVFCKAVNRMVENNGYVVSCLTNDEGKTVGTILRSDRYMEKEQIQQ